MLYITHRGDECIEWIDSAGRLPGTSTLTLWLPRFRCPRLAGSAAPRANGRLGCAAREWQTRLRCPLMAGSAALRANGRLGCAARD